MASDGHLVLAQEAGSSRLERVASSESHHIRSGPLRTPTSTGRTSSRGWKKEDANLFEADLVEANLSAPGRSSVGRTNFSRAAVKHPFGCEVRFWENQCQKNREPQA